MTEAIRAAQLRQLLERGNVILFREDRGDRFLAGAPGFAVILALGECAKVKNPPGPLCTAANELFGIHKDHLRKLQLPELFERSVDTRIVARSWSDSLNMFGTEIQLPNALFGTIVPRGAPTPRRGVRPSSWPHPKTTPPTPQRCTRTSSSSHPSATLAVVRAYTPAHEYHVPAARRPRVRFRLHPGQMRRNVKPNDVKGALAGVHLIMYNWGDNGGSTPSSEAVMTRLAVMEQSAKSESDMEKGMHVRTAMTFVGQHLDSNVQTVARPRLDTWLIPSLRVFPRLVAAIEKT